MCRKLYHLALWCNKITWQCTSQDVSLFIKWHMTVNPMRPGLVKQSNRINVESSLNFFFFLFFFCCILGYTWWCSRLIPISLLKNYSWGPYTMTGLNQGHPHARQCSTIDPAPQSQNLSLKFFQFLGPEG